VFDSLPCLLYTGLLIACSTYHMTLECSVGPNDAAADVADDDTNKLNRFTSTMIITSHQASETSTLRDAPCTSFDDPKDDSYTGRGG